MANKTSTSFDYEGGDLEAMMLAENYYRWIFDIIKPYIGKSVVEVGAGVGSFSKLIMKTNPKELALVEPAKRMHVLLSENIKSSAKTKVAAHNDYLSGLIAKLRKSKPDTFIYINVFEHIEDDTAELQHIAGLLEKDGHAIIFVPALRQLYSDFDKSIDHFRRYTKKDLRALCEAADLEVVKLRYMDMPGILPWFVSFKVLKRKGLGGPLVGIYDKYCMPIIRAIESNIEMPVGKNLLLVAKKRD